MLQHCNRCENITTWSQTFLPLDRSVAASRDIKIPIATPRPVPSIMPWTRRVRTVALENLSSGPVTVRQVTRGASLTWSDHVQNLPEYLRIPQKLPQKKIAWISHAAGFGGSGKSDEEIQEFYSRQNLGQPGCQWTHRNGVK